MTFRDIVELAFQRFKTRSLRFFLTVLGVGVGIGVVFFLVSLGFGLQEIVIGRIATSESLLSLTVAVAEEAESLIVINEDNLDEFKQIDHVEDVAPLLSAPIEVLHDGLRAQSVMQAVPATYFRYGGVEPTLGKAFSQENPEGIVVSRTFLRLFGLNNPQDALGKKVKMTMFIPRNEEGDATLREESASPVTLQVRTGDIEGDVQVINIENDIEIIGVLDVEENVAYVPLVYLDRIPGKTYAQAKVRVSSQENLDYVRSVIVNDGYSVISLTDTLDQLNQIFRVTQITLAVLGVVALFIASVGMFNTLTISLLERTREVGILKAIGATNLDVWKIFLFEAFLIGLLGGIAGLLGGFIFSIIVNWLLNLLANRFGGESVDVFATPLWFIATIITLSLSVGIITGFYPARRAARLNTKDALLSD